MAKSKKKKHLLRKAVIGTFASIALVGAFIGFKYYQFIKAPNVHNVETTDPYFYIPTGSNFEDVLYLLKAKNLLLKENSFLWVAEKKNYIKNVKPGRYKLEPKMNNNELVNLLRSGAQTPVHVTFNNVKTIPDLAGKVSKYLEPDSTTMLRILQSDSVVKHYGFSNETFISMFIPNTYEFYWDTSPEGFISRMANEFKSYWTPDRVAKAKALGLTQSEVSTLASIVQEETRKRDEMPKVAGLYLNRIKKGIKLQADPTVKFAVGDPNMKRIYLKHLKVDSPYNTYIVLGLPPGPIAMPEKQALDAVLNAEKHNYIFMCAKPDFSGYHNFATTLAAHNKNRQVYISFLKKQGIK